ncbi:MAG: Hpt domain-containing protein [Defluviitaleaceae bacterium]|nr:Hpt domain-containing protein [Defluviitaleaceae bacterium]
MDYSSFLPDIDVVSGKARVMDNMKLYQRLLGKFDAAKMAADVTSAVLADEYATVISAAHALRGTAANLGFPIVQEITNEIEILAKKEEDCKHLVDKLNDAISSLEGAIARLLEG